MCCTRADRRDSFWNTVYITRTTNFCLVWVSIPETLYLSELRCGILLQLRSFLGGEIIFSSSTLNPSHWKRLLHLLFALRSQNELLKGTITRRLSYQPVGRNCKENEKWENIIKREKRKWDAETHTYCIRYREVGTASGKDGREESGNVTINGNNTEGDDDRKRCREVNKVGNRCEKQRGSAGSSPAKYSLI